VPPAAVLAKAVQALESQKRSADNELSIILDSDDFLQAQELETDMMATLAEYQRLCDCFDEVSEYHDALLGDLSTATSRLAEVADSSIIESMNRDIALLEQQLNNYPPRRPDLDVSADELRRVMAQIGSTLSAEECSAAKAIEMEKVSAAELLRLEGTAVIRLKQVMNQAIV
jgi:hypothetical protein